MRAWFLPLFALLAACDDTPDDTEETGDTDPGTECFLTVDFSGHLDDSLDWDIAEGCGGAGDWESVTPAFGGLTTALNLRIKVMAEKEEIGSYPATVRITHASDGVWETPAGACTVDMNQSQLIEQGMAGESWRVGGQGQCTDAAVGVEGNTHPSVTVGDFAFRSDVLWN